MILFIITIVGYAALAALGIYAGRLLCNGITPFADRPIPHNPHPRIVIATAAVLGLLAAARGLSIPSLEIFGVVCGVLAAIWYSDLTRGIIPDAFTLLPLAAIAVAAGFAGRWEIIISALIPVVPFAVVAAMTRGRGMGWGDAKLAALGGALLGMQSAVLAFGIASLVAIVVGRFRADKQRPIAFAPYLVVAIALPLAMQTGGSMNFNLTNSSTGQTMADSLKRPKTPWARLIGLLFEKSLLVDQGMWFDDCGAVHTIGMRMAIDIIFLDRDGRVCRLVPDVQPGLPHIGDFAAKTVIEMQTGFIAARDILIGDRLELRGRESSPRQLPVPRDLQTTN